MVPLALSLGLIFAAKWGPAPCRAPAKWLLLAALVLKIGAAMPAAWQRIASQRHAGTPWTRAVAYLLPDPLRAMLRVELGIYAEAMCVLARCGLPSVRRQAEAPQGVRYTLHKGAISNIFLPLVILSSFVELPLLHLLIRVRAPEAIRPPLHMALLGLTLWGLLWALGDRSAVKHSVHVLGRGELSLNVGLRACGRLPLAAVAGVRPLAGRPRQWRPALAINAQDVVTLSPMDPPNLLVELRDGGPGVRITRFGVDVERPRYVAVYVDQAAAFQRDLLEAMSHET